MEGSIIRRAAEYVEEKSTLDNNTETLGVLPPKEILNGRNLMLRQWYTRWFILDFYLQNLVSPFKGSSVTI